MNEKLIRINRILTEKFSADPDQNIFAGPCLKKNEQTLPEKQRNICGL